MCVSKSPTVGSPLILLWNGTIFVLPFELRNTKGLPDGVQELWSHGSLLFKNVRQQDFLLESYMSKIYLHSILHYVACGTEMGISANYIHIYFYKMMNKKLNVVTSEKSETRKLLRFERNLHDHPLCLQVQRSHGYKGDLSTTT